VGSGLVSVVAGIGAVVESGVVCRARPWAGEGAEGGAGETGETPGFGGVAPVSPPAPLAGFPDPKVRCRMRVMPRGSAAPCAPSAVTRNWFCLHLHLPRSYVRTAPSPRFACCDSGSVPHGILQRSGAVVILTSVARRWVRSGSRRRNGPDTLTQARGVPGRNRSAQRRAGRR
jgi:hypothetical protein